MMKRNFVSFISTHTINNDFSCRMRTIGDGRNLSECKKCRRMMREWDHRARPVNVRCEVKGKTLWSGKLSFSSWWKQNETEMNLPARWDCRHMRKCLVSGRKVGIANFLSVFCWSATSENTIIWWKVVDDFEIEGKFNWKILKQSAKFEQVESTLKMHSPQSIEQWPSHLLSIFKLNIDASMHWTLIETWNAFHFVQNREHKFQ